MFFLEPDVPGSAPDLVFSASDLVMAAGCEYQVLRKLDEKLGRAPKAGFEADEMLQHAAVLGDRHELKVLAGFVEEFGPWDPATGRGVYDVAPAQAMDRTTLLSKHHESIEALRSGADVVFQAAFFDGQFHGRSDFLVRQADGSYAVFDTKLARHAKVTALLQLAAYGDQLLKAGITPDPAGDPGSRCHGTAPGRRLRLRPKPPQTGGDPAGLPRAAGPFPGVDRRRIWRSRSTVRWGAAGLSACGRCDYCQEQVAATDDLLLVARMNSAQRKKPCTRGRSSRSGSSPRLTFAGAERRAAAAAGPGPDAERRWRCRRRSPVRQGRRGTQPSATGVVPENTLAELPPPSAGDIFFDFEGDPLWQESATGVWGLEYLFGVIEAPTGPGVAGVFRPFWAHSREAEKQAFLDFLDYVQKRRQEYPDMHVYHYAAYEKTALRKLSVLHVAGEDIVDGWLREGLLVDLYQTVRNSIRISENSYSIKKLEPLYMGTNLRSGDVKDAGASVVAYAHYCDARDDGRAEEAAAILAGISDYNEYDCLSTLELRNWLLGLARERGIGPGGAGGASGLLRPADRAAPAPTPYREPLTSMNWK